MFCKIHKCLPLVPSCWGDALPVVSVCVCATKEGERQTVSHSPFSPLLFFVIPLSQPHLSHANFINIPAFSSFSSISPSSFPSSPFFQRQTLHISPSNFTSSSFSFPFFLLGRCVGSSSRSSQLGAKVLADSSVRVGFEDRMGGDLLQTLHLLGGRVGQGGREGRGDA